MKWFTADGELFKCHNKTFEYYAKELEKHSGAFNDKRIDILEDMKNNSSFVAVLDGEWNS